MDDVLCYLWVVSFVVSSIVGGVLHCFFVDVVLHCFFVGGVLCCFFVGGVLYHFFVEGVLCYFFHYGWCLVLLLSLWMVYYLSLFVVIF